MILSGRSIGFAILLMLFSFRPVFAQCDKNVSDHKIIQKTLEEYFNTSKVAGEPDAVVDWCYYGGWDQLFLFLMIPCESEAKAKAITEEIGLAILRKCRARRIMGTIPSTFEENVLKRGFTVQMMRKGVPGGSSLLETYINPSTVP